MVELKSIQLVKGFSILVIIISNTLNYWLIFGDDLKYIFGFIFTILDILGPSLYIFAGSLSISFTLKKQIGIFPEKTNRNKILKQAVFLILLGCLYNVIINLNLGFPANLWGWNILTFLGFSQILCYLSYRLVRWTRLVMGLSIIFLTSGFRELLFITKDVNVIMKVIHYIIVSPFPKYSLLPFASISFFSAVFGEFMFESIALNSNRASLHLTQSITKYGLVLFMCGLLLPLIDFGLVIDANNYDPTRYPFQEEVPILITHDISYLPGLPLFLLKGAPSNLFLLMGLALITIACFFYYSDVRNYDNKLFRFLNLYGSHSITIFFIQFLFILILFQNVELFLFVPFLLLYITILSGLFFLWQKNKNSILTLDWIMEKIGGKTID